MAAETFSPQSSSNLEPHLPNKRVVGVMVVCLIIVIAFGYSLFAQNERMRSDSGPVEVVEQVAEPTLASPSPKPLNLDFSASEPKPVWEFDTSEWRLFEDEHVGVRFYHPAEWGTPSRVLDYCDEYCNPEGTRAWYYRVTFPESSFSVAGVTTNFLPGRGMNLLYDFAGFTTGPVASDSATLQATQFCETPWFMNCEVAETSLTYTSFPACGGETATGFNYERVYMVNTLSGSKVSGLAFGGAFLSEDDPISSISSCDPEAKTAVDQALQERKLTIQQMKQYDLFGAVFETVELF